jgi:uncharacterized membrane protein YcjF (UPF0283 family)
MKPLEQVYWFRLALGFVAALVCIAFGVATNTITTTSFQINTFIDGVALALITYMISYYVIKWKFITKVQKPQKLFTTGIGIYLLSWIAFWTLMYTALAGHV